MGTRQLERDETTAPTPFDPALTYFADGTKVIMKTQGATRAGVACGRLLGSPYDFQAVRFDGEVAYVAPHVLVRA